MTTTPDTIAKPNIVLIISDDHGWRDSGCYGHPEVRTPNMDRLASEGMRFTHSFCASPLCSPSRAVIDTGLMPYRNGGHGFGFHIHPGTKTIAHYFGEMGYQTANLGKFSKHPKKAFPYEVSDDQWNPSDHDAGLVDAVDAFLKERNQDRPLFMQVNTADPHTPFMKNQDYDLSSLTVPPHLIDTIETREALADYYTSVENLDRTIGGVIDSLKKRGYADNTLVIYTTDHGPNFAFAKWCLYDEGIRAPFVAHWPGVVEPGTVTGAMISHADIMPTLIEAAGGTVPVGLDGQSFLDLLTGKKTEHRTTVFASHTGQNRKYPEWKANWNPTRAIRTRTHKYILNLNPTREFVNHITGCKPDRMPICYQPFWDSWVELAKTDDTVKARVDQYRHRPQHELYDLRQDPFEKQNIAADPENADLLKSLQSELASWREQQGDDVPVYAEGEYIAPDSRQGG